ncbi:MAG: ferrous iron transport protein A [Mycoplasmataceae bacterium]|jgi:Fe2+ transport system protein FeoA|nr:ferrous iron transport protein A [Mycoplasmataceae bacterium]
MQLNYQLKGKEVQVVDINVQDQQALHKMTNIGITKDTVIKVLDYDKNNKILHLLIYGVEYVLRERDCRYINVREYKDNKQFQNR